MTPSTTSSGGTPPTTSPVPPVTPVVATVTTTTTTTSATPKKKTTASGARARRTVTPAAATASTPPSGGTSVPGVSSTTTSVPPRTAGRKFSRLITPLVVTTIIIFVIIVLFILGAWGFRWAKGMISGTGASVSEVASVPHGKFTIIYDGNDVMDPVTFSTSFELYELVGKAAAAAPTNQTVFLSIKGQTRKQSVSRSFENRAALMDFVAKWGEEVYPPTITPVPSVPVIPRSSSTKTNTVSSAADTAFVNAEIERMRRERSKKVSALLVSGNPQRVGGLPPMSRPTGLTGAKPEQWVQVSGSGPAFSSVQPPAFDRPSDKKTCLGRWWKRVSSGPSFSIVTYTPRMVSWSHREAYPAPMYAGVGIFQPTPVMIGRSW